MKTPHKHAALIHAWADGAEIECRLERDEWVPAGPTWDEDTEYRIKPEPKPDVVEYRYVARTECPPKPASNLKLTFDGETGKLKSAEVL